MPDTDHGRFVWFDLMSKDPEGSKAFYPQVIDWGTQPWEGAGEIPYILLINGQAPIGGVMQLPEEAAEQGAPSHWLGYVAVDDVDASAAQAAELGANVMVPPTDIPEVGRFAVIADPHGAVIGIFKAAAETPGHDGPEEIGEISWRELSTVDIDAALGFYQSLFGWEKRQSMDMGPAGIYQLYGRNDRDLGGIYKKPPEQPGPPASWLYYVRISDIKAAVESVTSSGGQILNGPMEVPGGDMVAWCMDPQGTAFALHSKVQS